MLYLIAFHLRTPNEAFDSALASVGICRWVHPGCVIAAPQCRLVHMKKRLTPYLQTGDTLIITRLHAGDTTGHLPGDLATFANRNIKAEDGFVAQHRVDQMEICALPRPAHGMTWDDQAKMLK